MLTPDVLEYQKLDWKIEVTLSNCLLQKVLRPVILLVFYTKQGIKKTIYMDILQFADFRKSTALMMREFHKVETHTRLGEN